MSALRCFSSPANPCVVLVVHWTHFHPLSTLNPQGRLWESALTFLSRRPFLDLLSWATGTHIQGQARTSIRHQDQPMFLCTHMDFTCSGFEMCRWGCAVRNCVGSCETWAPCYFLELTVLKGLRFAPKEQEAEFWSCWSHKSEKFGCISSIIKQKHFSSKILWMHP